MSPMGFVAIIAGWVTTEVGRQPWLVYGHLRTSEGVSPLGAPAVATSLLAFVVIYFAVFGVGIWYILRLMHRPPHELEPRLKDVIEGPIRTAGITPAAQGLANGEDAR
jgi:cytochrome d ubiquinol oxidase subunit I